MAGQTETWTSTAASQAGKVKCKAWHSASCNRILAEFLRRVGWVTLFAFLPCRRRFVSQVLAGAFLLVASGADSLQLGRALKVPVSKGSAKTRINMAYGRNLREQQVLQTEPIKTL